MRTDAQTLPVVTWETGPELKVVERNGDQSNRPVSKPVAPPVVLNRARRELEVLGWEARVSRLISLSRGHCQSRSA
jgi:hypothetical protein